MSLMVQNIVLARRLPTVNIVGGEDASSRELGAAADVAAGVDDLQHGGEDIFGICSCLVLDEDANGSEITPAGEVFSDWVVSTRPQVVDQRCVELARGVRATARTTQASAQAVGIAVGSN